ncbi:MAG: nucleoside-diphosphate-sugar pyrophosphorylase [Thaumarchaeota archaeon]|nr:nucleoside-diphosphate-sugar pyrophosphorylase [Nitrososphaerota archaeon]
MKAVILAGGLGTRLQPYTFFMPKPMLPLGNKPLLEHIITWIVKNGVKEIVICVSYLGKTIENYFSDGSKFNVNIEYARSDRPLGTAGQLKSAEKFLDDTFLCIYGDSIYKFDLHKLAKMHKVKKALVTMTLINYSERLKYGFIEINGSKRVKSWNEKPEFSGLINIGCYAMEPQFLRYVKKKSYIGMDNVFMKALKANERIYGHVISSGFIDIGNKKSYMKTYKAYLAKLGNI